MKMIERIEINHNLDFRVSEHLDDTYVCIEKVMLQTLKTEEEYLIHNLYEIAKESGVGTLYIINKDEFARYIKETLPKWLRRTKYGK